MNDYPWLFHVFGLVCLLMTCYFSIILIIKCIYRNKFYETGILSATILFVIIPVAYLTILGELPKPLDFRFTRIPDLIFLDWQLELYVILFSIFSVLGYCYVGLRSNSKPQYSNHKLNYFKLTILTSTLYFLAALLLFTLSGILDADGHWAKSREEFNISGGIPALLLGLFNASIRILALFSAVACLYTNINLKKLKIIFIILICLLLVDLLTTGNRITTLLAIVLVGFWMLRARKFKLLIYLGLFIVPFGWFMTQYRIIRSQLYLRGDEGLAGVYSGFIDGLSLSGEFLQNNIFYEFLSGVTESVNTNVLFGISRHVLDGEKLLLGASYLKTLVWFIPRSVFPDKPDSVTVTAAEIFAPGIDISLATTLFGEALLNFGIFSVFLLPLILSLGKKIVKFLFKDKLIFLIASMSFGFIVVRMAFSDTLLTFLGAGLLFMLTTRYCRLK